MEIKDNGCGKEFSIWNPIEEEYECYGKCRHDILCPKCYKTWKDGDK